MLSIDNARRKQTEWISCSKETKKVSAHFCVFKAHHSSFRFLTKDDEKLMDVKNSRSNKSKFFISSFFFVSYYDDINIRDTPEPNKKRRTLG